MDCNLLLFVVMPVAGYLILFAFAINTLCTQNYWVLLDDVSDDVSLWINNMMVLMMFGHIGYEAHYNGSDQFSDQTTSLPYIQCSLYLMFRV
jgi:hypothetical protein